MNTTESLLKTRQQLIDQRIQIDQQLAEINTKLDLVCNHTQIIRCVTNGSSGATTYKCNDCGVPTNFYLWSIIIKTEFN